MRGFLLLFYSDYYLILQRHVPPIEGNLDILRLQRELYCVFLFTCIQLQFCCQDKTNKKNDNYKAVHSRAWGFPAVCPWSLWIFLKKPSHRSSRWMSKITLNVRGLGLTHPFVWFLFLSGTPCLICGRGEEARTDAVCFTLATAAQRIGSWWMLHPRTSLNRNLIQTHTGVRPLLHSFAHCCD